MSDSSVSNENNDKENNGLKSLDGLSQYLKAQAGTREGRAIPPLEKWHPTNIEDIDIVIKANGEWWHEGTLMTRQSLVSLFASILWTEKNSAGDAEFYLKTPVQMLRIRVEDAPLLINDVGVVVEEGVNWLEFTTTTGDVVRLDKDHTITLQEYQPVAVSAAATDSANTNFANADFTSLDYKSIGSATTPAAQPQVRPYMTVRNNLTALIGRNAFYHLTELGELSEQAGETVLTLHSGGDSYTVAVLTDPAA
jgi:hypothetical protein